MTLNACQLFSSNDSTEMSQPDEAWDGPQDAGVAMDAEPSSCADNPDRGDADLRALLSHMPRLRRYLRRHLPPVDADDVLQDVMVNLVRRGRASTITYPQGYLYRAAQSALVDRHRRQSARLSSSHRPLEDADHPIDELNPLRILMAREELLSLEQCLSRLPARTQEILLGLRVDGLSYKTLADRYGLSISAIEKHVTKAGKALSSIGCRPQSSKASVKRAPLRRACLASSI